VQYALQEAGYESTGQVLVDFLFNAEKIMAIKGMGPRAQASMDALAEKFLNPPAPEVAAEVKTPEAEAVVEVTTEPEAEIAVESDVVAAEAEEVSAEAETETVAEGQPEADVVEEPVAEEAEPEEEDVDFEEIFEVSLEQINFEEGYEDRDDDDDDDDDDDKKRRGKKGRKNVKLEFDPELGETVIKRKHKHGDNEWDEWGEWS
jgi:hypothetical protein